MVWIHGGGYEGGSAASYDYKKIVENFIARDVIVVTIQYRLGFLGNHYNKQKPAIIFF